VIDVRLDLRQVVGQSLEIDFVMRPGGTGEGEKAADDAALILDEPGVRLEGDPAVGETESLLGDRLRSEKGRLFRISGRVESVQPEVEDPTRGARQLLALLGVAVEGASLVEFIEVPFCGADPPVSRKVI